MSKIAGTSFLSVVGFVVLTAGSLVGQTAAPAYIVTRLGVDTVAIERYSRSSGKLEGDLVLRYPRTRTFHYVADLGPHGEVKALTTTVRRPGADPMAPPTMQSVSRFTDSIAVIEVKRDGTADTSLTGRKIFHGSVQPTFGTAPPAYGLYEQALSTANLGRDSVVYALVGPGGGPVLAMTMRRRGADSVAFTSSFFP
ncbi:MAG TPA: hypothetical protein VGO75_03040, partial [Gemmatimonadaceae bacterium]|nr:hypothetical protein [Gemmatimonadaceae bacterium]